VSRSDARNPIDGKPLGDPALDHALGQADDGTPVADPAERARWERLLDATALAFAPGLDRGAEARVTARVLARVREEESRAERVGARPAVRRGFWWKVVAASLVAHAAVFAATTWLARDRDAEAPAVSPFVVTSRMEREGDVATDGGATEPRDAGVLAALPDATAYDDRLAVERAYVTTLLVPVEGPVAIDARPATPLMSRAFLVRTSDPAKRAIEIKVGTPGSLDVRKILDALASRQRADGSFDAPAGKDASEATALVLLAFSGDGHSSLFGDRKDVVRKGIAFLRSRHDPATGEVAGGEHVLWALSDEFALAGAFMTPAEAGERAAEIRRLVARVAGSAPTETSRAALAAATKARLAEPQPVVQPAAARVDELADGAVRVGDAAERGRAILDAGDSKAFTRWMRKANQELRSLIDREDGLIRVGGAVPVDASDADRVEATARAILALQVPLR
jgi:hypothetical protein